MPLIAEEKYLLLLKNSLLYSIKKYFEGLLYSLKLKCCWYCIYQLSFPWWKNSSIYDNKVINTAIFSSWKRKLIYHYNVPITCIHEQIHEKIHGVSLVVNFGFHDLLKTAQHIYLETL